MRKLVIGLLVCFILTGCMPSNVDSTKNTGLKEYILYSQKENPHEYNSLKLDMDCLKDEDIEKLKSYDTTIYPMNYLRSNSVPDKDKMLTIQSNKEVIGDFQERGQVNEEYFSYHIFPYYNDNTIGEAVEYKYLGETTNDILPVYISSTLLHFFDYKISSDFNDQLFIDYTIGCPINVLGKVEYISIPLKVQVIGIIRSNTGNGDAYMEYNKLTDLIKQYTTELPSTDAYIVVSDNQAINNKISKETFSIKTTFEKRAW